MSNEANTLRGTGTVAETWRHFETEILPKVANELPPDLKDLSRMSFHFGALMMLNLVRPLSDRAADAQQLQVALAAFKDELESHLMARTRG